MSLDISLYILADAGGHRISGVRSRGATRRIQERDGVPDLGGPDLGGRGLAGRSQKIAEAPGRRNK